jgi:hypothetical protein
MMIITTRIVKLRQSALGEGKFGYKCGPGQPPEPHCYRGRSNCRLPPRRKIIAQRHSEERHAPMTS